MRLVTRDGGRRIATSTIPPTTQSGFTAFVEYLFGYSYGRLYLFRYCSRPLGDFLHYPCEEMGLVGVGASPRPDRIPVKTTEL